jgi:hypothetical protein
MTRTKAPTTLTRPDHERIVLGLVHEVTDNPNGNDYFKEGVAHALRCLNAHEIEPGFFITLDPKQRPFGDQVVMRHLIASCRAHAEEEETDAGLALKRTIEGAMIAYVFADDEGPGIKFMWGNTPTSNFSMWRPGK